MTDVETHLIWLGLEVAGLLVILASMDGLIYLLRLIVSRSQRKRDHAKFVERMTDYDTGSVAWDREMREGVARFRGKDADQIIIEARRGKG